MGKALALCCLAVALGGGAWAQQPAPAPQPQQAEQAPGPPAATPQVEAPPVAGAEAPATQPAAPSEPAEAGQPSAPPAAEAVEQPVQPVGPAITAFAVRGNEHISAETIIGALTASIGQPFSDALRAEQEQAVRNLGWFYDVDITTEQTEQGVRLVVNVVENPVINAIVIEGNTIYSDETLLALMESKPGQVSNNATIIRDLQAILARYNGAGYIFARIMDVTTEQGNLVITLVEGEVEELRVTGNHKTRTHVITREMRTQPGTILNRERLRRDLDRLMNMELFQDVSAQPTVGSAPGKVLVTINVQERKTGLAAAGLGYSSVQKLVGFVDVAEANLRGTGQRVTLRAEFGGRKSYELGYFAPWIAPPATSLQVGVYNKLILREAFTAQQGFLYDEKRVGGNVTWSRPLGRSETTRLYATLRADSISVEQTEEVALPEIIALQREEEVRSLGLALRKDTRDLIANPTRGGLNSVSMEAAGWLGGARFNKFGADLRRYLRAGGKRIVALRLLLGFTTGRPPFLEQFLLGGGETLRGYRNDRFPGTRMALFNSELRIPLQENMAGVLFVDVGDAWGGAFARDLGDTSFQAHVGYGVGLRLVTPIGPLRIDYGLSEEGQETHFSVGHAF